LLWVVDGTVVFIFIVAFVVFIVVVVIVIVVTLLVILLVFFLLVFLAPVRLLILLGRAAFLVIFTTSIGEQPVVTDVEWWAARDWDIRTLLRRLLLGAQEIGR
jgi:hypothetical protein